MAIKINGATVIDDSQNFTSTGTISATGNITGGNLIGNVVSTGPISTTGNVTGGNILTTGIISATGNITGGNLNVTGNIVDSGALTISTGSGDMTLAPSGNVSLSNKNINNLAQPAQDQDAATKLYVDNAVSTSISYHQPVVAATIANLATTTGGTITYNQPNGAGNGIGATLTTTGSFNLIDTANVQTVGTRILVKDEANAVFNGVYVWSNATVITRSTDADEYGAGNVDALGLNDYFFVSGGNVNKGSAYVVSAPTGTITFGTSNISFAQFSSSQTYTANTNAGLSLTGTVFSAKVDNDTTAFDMGGNIIVKPSANLTTPNIGAATGTSLSVTGNITGGNLSVGTGTVTVGNIVNANGNGVGNIGTSATRFNQVFALASSAQYADLAEKYTADSTYPAGTVVSFGGNQEVTISNADSDSRVAGVISTNPSFRMNDMLESEHTAMVALTGRVPTKVTGTVRKGDLMVSAGNGLARAEANPRVGTVIGKALADHDGAEGVIEVVVGRF